jgi:hypothetical protein
MWIGRNTVGPVECDSGEMTFSEARMVEVDAKILKSGNKC